MALPTISAGDLMGKGVTGTPANPELSVADLQAKFDELSIDVIVPKIQALVTALENASAGADLGVTAPTGITASNKVKSVLDAIAAILLAIKNKSDGDYDNLVALFAGVAMVSDIVDGSSSTIPTAKAIADFIQEIGGGDMLRVVYDTNNNGKVDDCDTNGGWRTYANLAAISGALTSASKLKDVIPLMADKSIIRFENSQLNLTDMTNGNEVTYVEIIRYSNARTVINGYRTGSSVTDATAAEYFALWDFDDVVVRGFYKLMDSNYIGTWVDIKGEITINIADFFINYVLYNQATREVRISMAVGTNVAIANNSTLITMPTAYRPTISITEYNCASAKLGTNIAVADWMSTSFVIGTDGTVKNIYPVSASMYGLNCNFDYIVR